MRIESLVENMSFSYLKKVAESFYQDKAIPNDEDELRKQILSNKNSISNAEYIADRLNKTIDISKNSYTTYIAFNLILRAFLRIEGCSGDIQQISTKISDLSEFTILKSQDSNSFNHFSNNSLDIFKTILEVAFEDDKITSSEINLINRLRQKLSLNTSDQFLVQASLNQFPKKENTLFTEKEIEDFLKLLQSCGVVFYCNKMKERAYIIPEEVVEGVKKYLDIELTDDKLEMLLDMLNVEELRDILRNLNMRVSGTKSEVLERIIITGLNPTTILSDLTASRLGEYCGALPDTKVSGTKEEKIERIINYFDQLKSLDVTESQNPNEIYYQVYEQLAEMDIPNLRRYMDVKSEKECANFFENATEYLFTEKLNHELVEQQNTDSSDGCIETSDGQLFMWDNKSSIGKKYKFDKAHVNQFKRYITNAYAQGKRVYCFLVIVPDFEPTAIKNAELLKFESGIGTDVAVISANNLKEIADEWKEKNPEKVFNLQVFTATKLLTRDVLDQRMKMIL